MDFGHSYGNISRIELSTVLKNFGIPGKPVRLINLLKCAITTQRVVWIIDKNLKPLKKYNYIYYFLIYKNTLFV